MSRVNLGGNLMPHMEITGGTAQNEKRALLVYCGEFNSMDGPVSITQEHLQRILDNHNARLSQLVDPKMGDYPPVQLDHSSSAKDTVGRLVGALEMGQHDGQPALYGMVRILGAENWERVQDGRWTHLSIGADLDKGELIELTITPFPAAKNAVLMKQGETEEETEEMAKKKKLESEETKKEHEDKETPAEEKKEEANLSADEDEDEKKRLADEEAAKKKEKEDEEKEETEKKKTEMSAGIKRFQEKTAKLRVALRAANLKSTFARLRSQGKLTPAELKKIDLSELASANDQTISAVLKSYENRQPVILVGQLGSARGIDAAKVAQTAKYAALEAETRANMTFTSRGKAPSKLNDESTQANGGRIEIEVQPATQDHDEMWSSIMKSLSSGDEAGAKGIFMKCLGCKMSSNEDEIDETSMNALMGMFGDLENEFSSVVRLTTAK